MNIYSSIYKQTRRQSVVFIKRYFPVVTACCSLMVNGSRTQASWTSPGRTGRTATMSLWSEYSCSWHAVFKSTGMTIWLVFPTQNCNAVTIEEVRTNFWFFLDLLWVPMRALCEFFFWFLCVLYSYVKKKFESLISVL